MAGAVWVLLASVFWVGDSLWVAEPVAELAWGSGGVAVAIAPELAAIAPGASAPGEAAHIKFR